MIPPGILGRILQEFQEFLARFLRAHPSLAAILGLCTRLRNTGVVLVEQQQVSGISGLNDLVGALCSGLSTRLARLRVILSP